MPLFSIGVSLTPTRVIRFEASQPLARHRYVSAQINMFSDATGALWTTGTSKLERIDQRTDNTAQQHLAFMPGGKLNDAWHFHSTRCSWAPEVMASAVRMGYEKYETIRPCSQRRHCSNS